MRKHSFVLRPRFRYVRRQNPSGCRTQMRRSHVCEPVGSAALQCLFRIGKESVSAGDRIREEKLRTITFFLLFCSIAGSLTLSDTDSNTDTLSMMDLIFRRANLPDGR